MKHTLDELLGFNWYGLRDPRTFCGDDDGGGGGGNDDGGGGGGNGATSHTLAAGGSSEAEADLINSDLDDDDFWNEFENDESIATGVTDSSGNSINVVTNDIDWDAIFEANDNDNNNSNNNWNASDETNVAAASNTSLGSNSLVTGEATGDSNTVFDTATDNSAEWNGGGGTVNTSAKDDDLGVGATNTGNTYPGNANEVVGGLSNDVSIVSPSNNDDDDDTPWSASDETAVGSMGAVDVGNAITSGGEGSLVSGAPNEGSQATIATANANAGGADNGETEMSDEKASSDVLALSESTGLSVASINAIAALDAYDLVDGQLVLVRDPTKVWDGNKLVDNPNYSNEVEANTTMTDGVGSLSNNDTSSDTSSIDANTGEVSVSNSGITDTSSLAGVAEASGTTVDALTGEVDVSSGTDAAVNQDLVDGAVLKTLDDIIDDMDTGLAYDKDSGELANGVYGGVEYINGVPINTEAGVSDGSGADDINQADVTEGDVVVQQQNATFNEVSGLMEYPDGTPFTGTGEDGLTYINGVQATGTETQTAGEVAANSGVDTSTLEGISAASYDPNGIYARNGLTYIGDPDDGNLANGVIGGKLYEDGVIVADVSGDETNTGTGGDDVLSGDGTNGDGTNGDGTNGDGTNGDGTNGDGTNGDGTNGDGTNGDGTNGDGTNGDGTDGDVIDGGLRSITVDIDGNIITGTVQEDGTVVDADGNVIGTYTIDPETGVGVFTRNDGVSVEGGLASFTATMPDGTVVNGFIGQDGVTVYDADGNVIGSVVDNKFVPTGMSVDGSGDNTGGEIDTGYTISDGVIYDADGNIIGYEDGYQSSTEELVDNLSSATGNPVASYNGLSRAEIVALIQEMMDSYNTNTYDPLTFLNAFGFAMDPTYAGGVIPGMFQGQGSGVYMRRLVKDRDTGELRYVDVPLGGLYNQNASQRMQRRQGFGEIMNF